MAAIVVIAQEASYHVSIIMTSLATLITALGGVAAILLNQRRQNSKIERNHNTTLNVERAVNHVDDEVATNGTPTLGQRLVQVQQEVKINAAQNKKQHDLLFRKLKKVYEETKTEGEE